MGWQHSFCVTGDRFLPSRVPFAFTEAWDPNTKVRERGPFKGQLASYGHASYTVPASVGVQARILHLAEIFVPLLPVLREHGADEWEVWIIRKYYVQYNEAYRPDEVAALARLGCSVCYSAFSVTEEEERRFRIENGYSV